MLQRIEYSSILKGCWPMTASHTRLNAYNSYTIIIILFGNHNLTYSVAEPETGAGKPH